MNASGKQIVKCSEFIYNHRKLITRKNCQIFQRFWSVNSEVYSEPCQSAKMDLFAKTVNGFQPLTTLSSILDVWQGFQYASKTCFSYLQISEVSPFSQSLRSRKFSHVFKLTLKNQAITDVLSKSWSKNFLKIHWKTPAMESF